MQDTYTDPNTGQTYDADGNIISGGTTGGAYSPSRRRRKVVTISEKALKAIVGLINTGARMARSGGRGSGGNFRRIFRRR